ncbi:polymorphic toxin-type HINT domain-containing protein [Streptacidiphilus sp. N1-3]|uniref:Polymorphic toxin-type HINT domain-containing protein n=1 Tax=Streptacidiphilus alkalitolerans TaxID=3342712 RepID=A0ABV6WTS5_9ACTN
MAVTRRYYDPYGNPRGTQPTTWISTDENHGFLGQPTDTNTGLNLLGARNYDPVQGRFLTPDPVFEAGDPNQMGGYTYAADNPATGSDPTGLAMMITDGGGGSDPTPDPTPTETSSGGTWEPGNYKSPDTTDTSQETVSAGIGRAFKWVFSPKDPVAHALDCMLGAGTDNPGFKCTPIAPIAPLFGPGIAPGEGPVVDPEPDPWAPVEDPFGDPAADPAAVPGDSDPAPAATGNSGTTWGTGVHSDELKEGETDPVAAAKSASKSEAAPSKVGKGDRTPVDSGAKCSFSPDTAVLMANGSTLPIRKLKVGDQVEAANPETGKEEGGRTVQHVWINHDKDLLDVTVTAGGGKTSVIHTTANHPFWDDTTHTWTRADHLKPHDHLASTHGQHPTVVATKATPGAADRWNLTVQQLHTYYVVAGSIPILVHNTNSGYSCYTSVYKTKLDAADFWKSRGTHFRRANAALLNDIQSDPALAQHLADTVASALEDQLTRYPARAPKGWVWNHALTTQADGQAGVMELVPLSEHTPGSPWWRVLHPGMYGAGGYSEWAISAGAPRN